MSTTTLPVLNSRRLQDGRFVRRVRSWVKSVFQIRLKALRRASDAKIALWCKEAADGLKRLFNIWTNNIKLLMTIAVAVGKILDDYDRGNLAEGWVFQVHMLYSNVKGGLHTTANCWTYKD